MALTIRTNANILTKNFNLKKSCNLPFSYNLIWVNLDRLDQKYHNLDWFCRHKGWYMDFLHLDAILKREVINDCPNLINGRLRFWCSFPIGLDTNMKSCPKKSFLPYSDLWRHFFDYDVIIIKLTRVFESCFWK